ncbi:MAG: hypothetical protein ACREOG_00375 [Gemmatimonadaceae bacterium]
MLADLALARGALVLEYDDLREVARHNTHVVFTARPFAEGKTAPSVGLVVAVGAQGESIAPAPSLVHCAEVTSRIRHPNVMRIAPPRTILGYSTYEQNLLSGRTLATVIESGEHESYDRVVAILRDAAAGLDAAHAMGIVHGALQPSCIYVDVDGPSVVDGFTGARGAGTQPFVFDPAAIAYEPPERRRTGRIDGRADQYALAVIAVEVLTGAHRAVRDHSGVLEIQALEIPVGRELAPGVPAHAADAIRRAMSRDPNARFETVSAFAAAFAGGSVAQQKAPHVVQIERKVSRRSPMAALLLMTAALFAAALVLAPNETTTMIVRTGESVVEWWRTLGGDVELPKVKGNDTPAFGAPAPQGTAAASGTKTSRSQTSRANDPVLPPAVDRTETSRRTTRRLDGSMTAAPSPPVPGPDRRESGRAASALLTSGVEATPTRGVLVIVTDAGRPLVGINRIPRGRAPLALQLRPGTYRVSLLSRLAYRPKIMQVTVAAGDTAYAEFEAPDAAFTDDTLVSLGLKRTITSAGM